MEIQKYFNQKKEIYDILLKHADSQKDNHEYYSRLVNLFELNNFFDNHEESLILLHTILGIAGNHHRYPDFLNKIDQLFLFFFQKAQQTLSNSELFELFKNHKRNLLFLFKNKILTFDESIIQYLRNKTRLNGLSDLHYFYSQIKLNDEFKEIANSIKNDIQKVNTNILTEFDEKCEIGENDSEICEIIRKDSIEDFISYLNKTKLEISTTTIKPSFFETNSFLLDKEPTLIEYASFFGSIQIIKYLEKNDVELTPSLWLYAIHSNNAELIRFLDEKSIKPVDRSFKKCIEESIKCHHNEIAQYLQRKTFKRGVEKMNRKNNFDETIVAYRFRYFNFSTVPIDLETNLILCYLCRFNYITLVEILMKDQEIDISESIISKKLFFFIKFQNNFLLLISFQK